MSQFVGISCGKYSRFNFLNFFSKNTDLDDWDLPDKKFFWKERDNPHPKFLLDEDTGTITMKPDVRPGKYEVQKICIFYNHYYYTVNNILSSF